MHYNDNFLKEYLMPPVSKQISSRIAAWLMRRTPKTGGRRVVALSAAVSSDIGVVRVENQDRVAIARGNDFAGRSFILVALSDGIGGMKNGAECAATALGTFFGTFFEEMQLEDEPMRCLTCATHKANLSVHDKFGGEGGATLVAVLISAGGLVHWLSVGDSRVYHSLGTKLTQISVDDTIAGQLGKNIDAGLGQSNLLQFIGMGKQLEPHIARLDTGMQGSVLLTSDGVHFLHSEWLGQIVGHSSDPGMCVRRLAELSKWCGGTDNASVAMIALDAEINDNPIEHSEAGLEIWDSFGELQIIDWLARSQQTATVSTVTSVTPNIGTNASASNSAYPATQPEVPQPKPTRSKSSRKPKLKHKDPLDKVDEDVAVPQLLMKFSNKATD